MLLRNAQNGKKKKDAETNALHQYCLCCENPLSHLPCPIPGQLVVGDLPRSETGRDHLSEGKGVHMENVHARFCVGKYDCLPEAPSCLYRPYPPMQGASLLPVRR